MRLLVKINKIQAKNIEVLLLKCDDIEKKATVKLTYNRHLHDILFRYLGDLIVVNMKDGNINKFLSVAPDDLRVYHADVIDWRPQVLFIIKERMTKQEFYDQYCKLAQCSERTAIRRLGRMIGDGKVKEVDRHTIEKVTDI